MGIFDFLKKKEEKNSAILPVIHDICLGRTVIIDDLAIKLLGKKHKLALPTNALTITGQGTVKFEDGVWLHRFYTDDHILLQIMGGDGIEDKGIQQVSLFSVYDTIEPSSEAIKNRELAKICAASYSLDGAIYNRIWFEGEGPCDPVQFHETVNLSLDGTESYGIQQSCMLFGREVEGNEESLLVTHEKTDQGDETISMMVGALLSPNDISI